MVIRHPIYELADIVVESDDTPLEETVNRVCQALAAYSAKTSQNGKT
jgi:hypothetical protein